MAKNKTTENELSVDDFLNEITDEAKRRDSFKLLKIMHEETGYTAKMWGGAIIGFGSYHYKYESGHEGDAPLIAFSPRAKSFSLYIGLNQEDRSNYLQIFGKHKASKGCIYINKLADVDETVLRSMILSGIDNAKKSKL